MVSVTIEGNIKHFNRSLDEFSKKAKAFVIKNSLNATAFELQKRSKKLAVKQLHKPAPYTLRGFRVKKATTSQQKATLYINDVQAGYLSDNIDGRIRSHKDYSIFDPVNFKTNARGNIAGLRRGRLKRLADGKRTFVMKRKGNIGIYRRVGGKRNPRLKLLIAIRDKAKYERRFTWYRMLKKSTNKIFTRNLVKEINKEIKHIEKKYKKGTS